MMVQEHYCEVFDVKCRLIECADCHMSVWSMTTSYEKGYNHLRETTIRDLLTPRGAHWKTCEIFDRICPSISCLYCTQRVTISRMYGFDCDSQVYTLGYLLENEQNGFFEGHREKYIDHDLELVRKLKMENKRGINSRRIAYALYRLHHIQNLPVDLLSSQVELDSNVICQYIGRAFKEQCLRANCVFKQILQSGDSER